MVNVSVLYHIALHYHIQADQLLPNRMKLDKAPTESYADIGGLEQQIQEIKVGGRSSGLVLCVVQLKLSVRPAGICRTTLNASRIVRGNGYQTT